MSEQLPHLSTFVEAAERGGFTAAARQLKITQAAVSQRIQQLETVLKTSLFRREGGRVSLSEAGRQLHQFARRILDLTDEARVAVTGRRGSVTRQLVLASSSVPGQHLLPPILARFSKRHSDVQVKVSISDTDDVLRVLERGEAHLGFVGGVAESPHLEFQPFATDELLLVVSPRHAWKKRRKVTPQELIEQPLIQREQGSASRRFLERAMEQAGLSANSLNVVMELGSSETIIESVGEGLGVAILSRRAVQKDVQSGRLHSLRVEGLPLERTLFVVRDRRKAIAPAATAFLAMLAPKHS